MVVDRLTSLAGGVARGGWATAKVVHRLGLTSPVRPDRMLGVVGAIRHWGRTPAGMYAANAARYPDQIAVIDERESVTFAEIDRRSSIVAAGLAEQGVATGDSVALLARNSSAFIVAMVAVAKLGADLLYANTGFAGPQLGDVLDSENAAAIIADDEFADIVREHAGERPRLWAWTESDDAPADSIAGLVAAHGEGDAPAVPSPGHEGRHVILTSGTTGRPKGASRGSPSALAGAVSGIALLDAIPYKAGGVTVLAAPAFHAWGWGNVTIGMLMHSTLVMTRRFDPAVTLELVEKHGADTIAAVPVMCQRMLDVEGTPDTSSLRIVALSGSALAPTLATRFMDRIGDDGRLYVEGRDDDMIVSGGENVFPAEVEDVMHKHEAVSDVAVIGVADDKFGQALVAHVVLRDGAKATADELRGHVKKQLANYKVPREIVFHDSLPRNEPGKVLKRVLADPEG